MKVAVAHGTLPDRDASLSDVPHGFFRITNLSVYRQSTEMKTMKQQGQYRSRQGPTITPIPLWAVQFQTVKRRSDDSFQILPSQEGGQYIVTTAKWASEVVGTGVEKEKWRNVSMTGPCSLNYIYATVTSAWLVPFALAHRYLVHVPAETKGSGKSTTITIRHDFTSKASGLEAWTGGGETDNSAIRKWTSDAQMRWTKSRTNRSTPLVTEWLDYRKKLSSEQPKAYRVVHTRSRTFYAAVLDPKGSTALGMPYSEAKLYTVEGNKVVNTRYVPIAGVICDNLLHSITVDSKDEACWMSGLFNSKKFNDEVMKEAKGEPPGIYTLPVKIMEKHGLAFDPNNSKHLELARVAEVLEKRMQETLRNYLSQEKGLEIKSVDDTDRSPDVPSTISSALMRRLDAKDDLGKLNKIAEAIT